MFTFSIDFSTDFTLVFTSGNNDLTRITHYYYIKGFISKNVFQRDIGALIIGVLLEKDAAMGDIAASFSSRERR